MHGCCSDQLTVLDQPQLGRAATDVDVQNTELFVVRALGCTRAINGQHGFHVVAGRCANKLTALLGLNSSDRFAVFTAQGFTCQDHGACINVIRVQTRRLVSIVNDDA